MKPDRNTFCEIHGLRHHYLDTCFMCAEDKKSSPKPKVQEYHYHGELHQDVLLNVFDNMPDEEKIEMEIKVRELAATKKFSSYESRLLFEDAFRSGYLSKTAKKIK